MGGADDKPSYLRPYQEAVEKMGPRFEALLWNARQTQQRRFGAIADMVGLGGRVVADLGCGRADLAAFIHSRGVGYTRYVGVEGVEELLEASRERARDEALPSCEFLRLDFVADASAFKTLVREHAADVLVFSGSLNTLRGKEARRVLERAWDALATAPGRVLVFNFLSDLHPSTAETGPAHRFRTAKMTAWAMERTPLVRVRTDYLNGHDATIAMRVPGD